MTKVANKKSWFRRFSLIMIVGGVVLLALLIRKSDSTFPALPYGSYVGKVSNLSAKEKSFHSFYVERTPHSDSILVVVFSTGWPPQFVPTKKAYHAVSSEDALTKDVPFEPLVLNHSRRKFTLSGVRHGNEYRGDIESDSGREGIWSLKKVEDGAVVDIDDAIDMDQWLARKAKELSVSRELKLAKESLDEMAQKKERLAKFVTDGELLRKRADERRQALEAEVKVAKKGKAEVEQKVSNLVSELGLLGRITKRGKAVSLARKVAAREKKWYFANWRAEEDVTGLEEFLAANSNIDVRQLEHEVRRAQEAQSLERQVLEEKRRMQQLEAQIRNAGKGSQDKKLPKTRKPGKRKNLWDSIFGSGDSTDT